VGGEHAPHEEEADRQGGEGGQRGADEDEPFTPSEGELLVAAFGGEQVHHVVLSPCVVSQSAGSGVAVRRSPLSSRRAADRRIVRVTWTWRATRSPIVRVLPSISTTRGPSNGCFSSTVTSTPGTTPRLPRNDRISASVDPDTATTATSPGSRS